MGLNRKTKVGIFISNPETIWRSGGGELHAQAYLDLLDRSDFEVDYFHPVKFKSLDILHYFGSNYQLGEYGRYARMEGILVVGTPILFPVSRPWRHKLYLRFSELLPTATTIGIRKQLLLNSDKVIANSRPEAMYFSNVYGVPEAKIEIIPTGVGDEFLSYVPGRPFLGEQMPFLGEPYWIMVGRVLPLKGQVAVAQMFATSASSRLLIVGQPSSGHEEYCVELSEIVKANSNLMWIEGIRHGDPLLKELYSRAVGHILWSQTEVAALVNLEAGALGTLVVSRGHTTTRDILGDYAFYADNISELKNLVQRLTQLSEAERIMYTSRLRQYIAENHTWPELVSRTAKLYKRLIRDRTSDRSS